MDQIYPKKGISSLKQNKHYKRLFCVVNVNSVVVFKHFEDLKKFGYLLPPGLFLSYNFIVTVSNSFKISKDS